MLRSPRGLAVDVQRRLLYVVDTDNNRVVVMTFTGAGVRVFGSKGSGPGQLSDPCGIALDGFGNALVADSNNRRIVVYKVANGLYLTHFSTPMKPYFVMVDSRSEAGGAVLVGGEGEDGCQVCMW